jgi:HSP20 family molecular chaperone IbpA
VAPRCLCILGKHEEEPAETGVAVQRNCKRIFRLLDLPCEIDPDGMKTTVHDGLLEITLRKAGVPQKEREIARAATA